MNKLLDKLKFILKSSKAKKSILLKIKKCKNLPKNNFNVTQNEFKLFQILFNNKKNSEEIKKKLHNIFGVILERNNNINI